jgi:hypothetical protein
MVGVTVLKEANGHFEKKMARLTPHFRMTTPPFMTHMATVVLRGMKSMANRPNGTATNPTTGTMKQFVRMPVRDI